MASRAIEFGSRRGRWVYEYVGSIDGTVVAVATLGAIAAVGLHALARRWVDARPAIVVSAVLLAGIAVQLGLRALYPYSMARVVTSDVANAFYGTAARVSARDLLGNFKIVATTLPLHAQHNMPGKLLLYQALRAITSDPQVVAIVIVVLSSLGGPVLYALCRRLFGRRSVALDAMVLWMLVPAKIGFHPLLNVVSPVPALTAVWCGSRFLGASSVGWAIAAGVLAYATALFDPLALWIGVVFAPALLVAAVRQGRRPRETLALVVVATASLVTAHFLVRTTTGFDIWEALVGQVPIFERQLQRPYDVWVRANLKDVALAAGPAVTVAFVAAVLLALLRLARGGWGPGPVTALMSAFVLAVLERLGFDRGEVARLWIFLLAPVQVAVAWCLGESDAATRPLVVAGTFAFAAVTAAVVGYCVP